MHQNSEIFEKNYMEYCAQIANFNFISLKEKLRIKQDGNQIIIPFFDNDYFVSKEGIVDKSGTRPGYMVCVILSKYLLLCPESSHYDTNWVSFKDFKKTSHFLNVNYFASDTEKPIVQHFSGRLDALTMACEKFGGLPYDIEISYDLVMRFDALPRISLLLLFNDSDEEFPAHCSVLFQKQAEYYLDPESLAMTSAFLAKNLKVQRKC
jgi:hypothetical protein